MRSRRGFTLIEIIISLTLLMIITGAAVSFLRKQTGLVTRETSRMDAMQNAQFAGNQIERELREAGAGVADAQPMIVQLDSEAITFNANMVSIDTGDVRAVYQLTDADTNGTRAMLKSERMSLPNSSPAVGYPDTTYTAATGIESGAETISYFLRPDSTTTRTNDYLLFRRLNARPATLIARGIVRDPRDTIPFFTYYKSDTLNRLRPILKSQLPLYHVMIHGAVNDTGNVSTSVATLIRAAGENVGTRAITGGTLSAPSGSAAGNYIATLDVSGSPVLTITAAPLSAAIANQSKIYGADDPALAGITPTLTGVVNRGGSGRRRDGGRIAGRPRATSRCDVGAEKSPPPSCFRMRPARRRPTSEPPRSGRLRR